MTADALAGLREEIINIVYGGPYPKRADLAIACVLAFAAREVAQWDKANAAAKHLRALATAARGAR